MRSSRLLVASASRPRASAWAALRRAGGQLATTDSNDCGRTFSGVPESAAEEARAEFGQGLLRKILPHVNDPLFHLAGVRDQHREHLAGCQQDEFDVAHLGPAEMRVLDDGDLVGQLREQPDGPVQDVVEVIGSFQQGLDGAPFGRRERLDRRNLVHEEPVALVGGDPAGARVRRRDEALILQCRHVVADRGTGHAQVVPFHEGFGADGFP